MSGLNRIVLKYFAISNWAIGKKKNHPEEKEHVRQLKDEEVKCLVAVRMGGGRGVGGRGGGGGGGDHCAASCMRIQPGCIPLQLECKLQRVNLPCRRLKAGKSL